jgi:biopolymer transport protein ExbB
MILLQADPIAPSLDVIALLMKGGIVMAVLIVLSMLALIVIMERLLFFGKNMKSSDAKLQKLATLISSGKSAEAQDLCASEKNSWGRVFTYAAMGDSSNPAEIDKLMEDAANIEVGRLEKGLTYLSMIAGLAPLLGFIGTIIGVINIFFSISVSKDISIGVISEGLYQKMVSSAAGLVVGIIAFSAYHLLQNSIDGYVGKLQEQALALRMALTKKK